MTTATATPILTEEDRAQLDAMIAQYKATALWSSCDESDPEGGAGDPLDDNFTAADFSEAANAQIERDCAAFLRLARPMIGDRAQDAGYNFWLARNGHGVCFTDGDWPENDADTLQALAQLFDECDPYVSDSGEIDLSGGRNVGESASYQITIHWHDRKHGDLKLIRPWAADLAPTEREIENWVYAWALALKPGRSFAWLARSLGYLPIPHRAEIALDLQPDPVATDEPVDWREPCPVLTVWHAPAFMILP